MGGLGLSWQATFGIILTLYFYSHYFFASGVLLNGAMLLNGAVLLNDFASHISPPLHPPGAAHIGAMYTAFLSVAIACGTPGLMAALALGELCATVPGLQLKCWRSILLAFPNPSP